MPFGQEEDPISILQGSLFYKHPWKDSPRQKLSKDVRNTTENWTPNPGYRSLSQWPLPVAASSQHDGLKTRRPFHGGRCLNGGVGGCLQASHHFQNVLLSQSPYQSQSRFRSGGNGLDLSTWGAMYVPGRERIDRSRGWCLPTEHPTKWEQWYAHHGK